MVKAGLPNSLYVRFRWRKNNNNHQYVQIHFYPNAKPPPFFFPSPLYNRLHHVKIIKKTLTTNLGSIVSE